MYTVTVCEDYAVIETETFATLGEAFNYADKYCIEYYTEINNIPYGPYDLDYVLDEDLEA